MNNRTYTSALFSEVLGSFEPEGGSVNRLVDYWWTDWGGCANGAPKMPDLAHDERGRCSGSANLWWGNYVFTSDPGRFGGEGASGGKRGLVLSRYGGLGTHRCKCKHSLCHFVQPQRSCGQTRSASPATRSSPTSRSSSRSK